MGKLFYKNLVRLIFFGSILAQTLFLNVSIAQTNQDVCGRPAFDRTIDRGVFVWKNCGTGLWSFRVSSGGRPTGDEYRVEGSLKVSIPMPYLDGFSLDAGQFGSQDLFDISDPNELKFIFRVWGSAQDGFDFLLVDGTTACLKIVAPNNLPIVFGSANKSVVTPINLDTLTSTDCADPGSGTQILLLDD